MAQRTIDWESLDGIFSVYKDGLLDKITGILEYVIKHLEQQREP